MGKSKVKIENNIVKGEEVPLKTSYVHLGKYILDSISRSPDKVAQIDAATGETDTFADVKDRSIRCAHWLRKQGIGLNDVIVIRSHNHLDTCVPVFASLYLGAPYFPNDDILDIKNTKYFLSLGKPKIIFVSKESADVLLQAVKELESDAKIVAFGEYPGVKSFADILAEASEQEVANFKCNEIPDSQHIAMISPTSGTTGMPKGVTLSHEYFIRTFQLMNDSRLLSEAPILLFSKLMWISTSFVVVNATIRGSSRIICTHFTPQVLFDIINKYKPYYINLAANTLQAIVKSENLYKCDFSSVEFFILSGSYVNSESLRILRKLAKNVTVGSIYGMTEVGIVSFLQSEIKPGCVGTPFQNVQIKIADLKTGQTLAPNQQGEICVKSPTTMLSYYNNPEATKATVVVEGFMHTGDVGYYDENGNLFLIDRLKALIKCRGIHIAATEIETILHSHPAVLEAAVVGKRHEIDTEHPIAFVIKVPGQEVSEQELIDLVAKEVMDQKRLRGGVIFLESLPYTATGKIDRMKLREMANSTLNGYNPFV